MITLNTVIPERSAAHNCVKLCFLMDDIGSGNISKSFTWFVCDAAGNRLHKLDKQKKPKLNEQFCIDVSEFRCELETAIPQCTNIPLNDNGYSKEIKVHYGEISFNSNDCSSVVGAKTISPTITLLNAALNSWNLYKFNYFAPQTGILLTARPKVWKMCKGGEDYMWYYGSGSATLRFYNDTTLVQTISHALTGSGAKYFSTSPACYGITDPCISLVEISVNNGATTEVYKTKIEKCCCNEYYGILFLEPCGGRSLFPACNEQITINRTGDEVCKSYNCFDSTSNKGRNSLINVATKKELSFKVQIEKNSDTINFVEMFFASAGHHIQKGKYPNTELRKFVLTNGGYTIYNKIGIVEVTFTGYISEELNTQREDV